MEIIRSIQNRIFKLAGIRVMHDFDPAARYDVDPRVLNHAGKRNSKRFPEDFLPRLTKKEFASIQLPRQSLRQSGSSQTVMIALPQNRTGKYLPYALTEQGVAMLSGVLNSDKAINMNITVMRAFLKNQAYRPAPDRVKATTKRNTETSWRPGYSTLSNR